jgi:hypothetical protein
VQSTQRHVTLPALVYKFPYTSKNSSQKCCICVSSLRSTVFAVVEIRGFLRIRSCAEILCTEQGRTDLFCLVFQNNKTIFIQGPTEGNREIGTGISEASKRVPIFPGDTQGGKQASSYFRQRNWVQAREAQIRFPAG